MPIALSLFHKLKRSCLVASHSGTADVKPFRQAAYVDFDNRVAIDDVLQDELAGGVVDAYGLDAAVGVGEVELIGGGVRVDAELHRVVVLDADMGGVGLVKVGDAVAVFGVGVAIEVAALANYLHYLGGGIDGHGLSQTGAKATYYRSSKTGSIIGPRPFRTIRDKSIGRHIHTHCCNIGFYTAIGSISMG